MLSIRSFSIASISYALQLVMSGTLYIIIARVLTVTEVGAISLFLSLESILVVVLSLNLDASFIHFISFVRARDGRNVIPTLFTKMIAATMIFSAIVIIAFRNDIASTFFHSTSYSKEVLLLGLFTSETIGVGYFTSILQGLQKFERAATINIIYAVLSTGIPILMILFGEKLYFICLGFVLGAAISILVAFMFIIWKGEPVTTANPVSASEFFRYTIPIYIGFVFSSLMTTVDRVILPALSDLALTAIYTYSVVIATVITTFSSPITFFLFPKISRLFASSNKEEMRIAIRGSMEIYCFLSFPSSIGGAIVSEQILYFLVGGVYVKYYYLLSIMLISYTFFSFRPILSSYLLGNRKTHAYMTSGVSAFVSNVILSVWLIPIIGIFGALIASIAAWLISTIPRFVVVSREINGIFSIAYLLKTIENTIVMCFVLLVILEVLKQDTFSFPFTILVSFLAYVGSSRINSPFSNSTIQMLREAANDKSGFASRVMRIIFKL